MNEKLRKFFIGKRGLKERFAEAFVSALALSFILLFFGPLDLADSAESFVDFTMIDVLPTCLKVWLAAFMGLFLIAWLAGGRVHAWLVSVFTGLAMAFYVQAHWLNPDLGILDGSTMDWTKFADRALFDLLLFVAVLMIPLVIHFFSRKVWKRFVLLISVTLTLMQAIPLGTKLLREKPADDFYRVSKKEEYLLGSEQNIIFFILDFVSHTDLNHALETYPDMLAGYRDFIEFDNLNTLSYGTFPSATYLLTNQALDFEHETPDEYFARAWHSADAEAFYSQMHEAGWDTLVYNNPKYSIGDLANAYGKLTNVERADQPERFTIRRSVFKKLIFLSFYRYFPLVTKAPFRLDTADLAGMKNKSKEDSLWNSFDSIDKFWNEGVKVGERKKVFRSYHYIGVHQPCNLDRWGHIVTNSENSGINEQLAGQFMLIAEYMTILKDLGLYDSSTVIITTDHGTMDDPSAIFFIKPAERRANQMEVSHAPITQGEILETISQSAGLTAGQFGRSVFEVGEDEIRNRCSYIRGTDSSYPAAAEGKHENIMTEYCTSGNADEFAEMIKKKEGKVIYSPYSFY